MKLQLIFKSIINLNNLILLSYFCKKMKFLKITFSIFLLLIPIIFYAQIQITGVVKDKNTGTEIENAKVLLKPTKMTGGGFYTGVLTTKNGMFTIKSSFNGKFNIIASKDGCEGKKVKIIKGKNHYELLLDCSDEAIKEIILEQNSDKDQDGVLDSEDKCPDEAGKIENEGCPWLDSDDDGVLDNTDLCPEEKGSIENIGCPWPDSDNDGVSDNEDTCPEEKGSIENNGCPTEPLALISFLNSEKSNIFFEFDSFLISEISVLMINELANLLIESPKSSIVISGHTSNEGSLLYNKNLSDKRAEKVKHALELLNIEAFRITTIGYGEEKPIETNNNDIGRVKNRRVEITIK